MKSSIKIIVTRSCIVGLKNYQIDDSYYDELNKIKRDFAFKNNSQTIALVLSVFNQYKKAKGFDFIDDAVANVENYLKDLRENHPPVLPPLIDKMKKMVGKFEP